WPRLDTGEVRTWSSGQDSGSAADGAAAGGRHAGAGPLLDESQCGGGAVAGALADRRQEAAVPVHAVAIDPRAELDPAAGFAWRAHHLCGADPNTEGADGGDERGERSAASTRRRLYVPAEATDSAVPDRAGDWRSGVPTDERADGRVGGAVDSAEGGGRVQR